MSAFSVLDKNIDTLPDILPYILREDMDHYQLLEEPKLSE